MLRNRSCSRAFSLAARLCCSEDVAWSHGTPAAVHLLQLLRQKHTWMSTSQPSSSSTTPQCHSNAAQQQHTQLPAPAVRRLWPAALACNDLGTCRTYAITTTTSSSSSGSDVGEGETSQNAASARPRDLALVFTCAKCDTRAVKAFSRQAYEQGLVLITCPGCKSMHLIADHLGWFGDSGFKIDEYLASQGHQVKRLSMAQLEEQPAQVTAEDMAGWSKEIALFAAAGGQVQQLLSTVAGAAADGAHAETSGGCCGSSGHAHTSTHDTQASNQSPGSTKAAAAASAASGGSSEASTSDDSSMDHSMLQEAHSGVVEVAPSDVAAWARVQQQKQHGEGR